MICDGCKIDKTITVVTRDYSGRVTRRCRSCGGADDTQTAATELEPTLMGIRITQGKRR